MRFSTQTLSGWQQGLWPWFLVAMLAPTLLAPSDPPMITFYNQVLAVGAWGACLIALAAHRGERPIGVRASGPLWALSGVLAVCSAAAMVSVVWRGLPLGLALMAVGSMAAAALVLWGTWTASAQHGVSKAMDLVAMALAFTAMVAIMLSVIQVFAPQWADGVLIAIPSRAGRAVANLRQPNHLSTLLVMGAMASVWVARRGLWPAHLAWGVVFLAMGAVVMTASRTGMVGSFILLLWAWRDRTMPRHLRMAMALAPVFYAVWWAGMYEWNQAVGGSAFAGAARLNDGSDISSSRFKIWANVWSLIQAHPWFGVGWGEFNVAWTLTSFPGRPTAFFDHTHNLVMQWAVELGVPLTLLLLVLLAVGFGALWRTWPSASALSDPQAAERHSLVCAAGAMVAMVGLHSLLEYPLWYAYFMLPTAAVWGVGLAAAAGLPLSRGGADEAPAPAPSARGLDWRRPAGAALVVGAAWCAIDYQWAVNIYAPRYGHAPLADRIAAGQQRLWFGYQADYAHVTGPDLDEPSLPPQAFHRTLHNLVDTRLMTAYARSLHEHGEVDKARFVVARMLEFKPGVARGFLLPCRDQTVSLAPKPFQCEAPQRHYAWHELLPRQ